MKSSNYRPIIFFALVAALLNEIFFYGLSEGEFIFSGDQFFQFSAHEAFTNSFFLRKPIDLGVLNGWQFTTQFWDALYYLAAYYVNLTPIFAEKILFFLVLFLSLYLSFLGFNKAAPRFGVPQESSAIYFVTLWYCFNPYTLELWHGGVYNLGSSLTYSLAPLIIYQFDEAVFSPTDKAKILLCALLMLIASFTFWLLAPLVFFLTLYTIFRLALQIGKWRLASKNISLLLLAYVPLVSFVLFGIMHEYFNNSGDNNAGFSPTFGNMQGGIWYQLNMLFSWGIYTVWTPRTMYPFGEYFFSKTYIAGIVLQYAMIALGLVVYFIRGRVSNWDNAKSLSNNSLFKRVTYKWIERVQRIKFLNSTTSTNVAATQLAVVLVLIFAIAVFLAKGAQPPLGEVFLFLYNHVPFFNVFRTPDIRFGFAMVLALALLLLFVSQVYGKAIFRFGLLAITLVLAWPFFSGAAVRGENRSGLYYDRIVHIPDSYSNLAAYINQHNIQNSYTLPIPAVEYGNYALDQSEHFIGQDMVAKLSKYPFVYISPSGGMSTSTYAALKNIIESKQYDKFRDFPIRYLLLRKDICPDCPTIPEKDLAQISDIVYHDSMFSLYEMRNYRSIIDSPNVSFERVSPVKYRVSFHHVTEPQELTLLQNFNKDWKVFLGADAPLANCFSHIKNTYSNTVECINNMTLLEMDDWKYLWKPSLFESSHLMKWGYANSWEISPNEIRTNSSESDYSINADGSLNFTLTVYYQPEIRYLLTGMLSLFFAVIFFGVLLVVFRRHFPSQST